MSVLVIPIVTLFLIPCRTQKSVTTAQKKEALPLPSLISVIDFTSVACVYHERMCSFLLGEAFDQASCAVLVDIETKVVNAGLITWEEIGQIEDKYYEI